MNHPQPCSPNEPESAIHQSQSEMEDEIANLAHAADTLRKRLAEVLCSVISTAVPDETEKDVPPDAIASILRNRLDLSTRNIREVTHKIIKLIDDLEL